MPNAKAEDMRVRWLRRDLKNGKGTCMRYGLASNLLARTVRRVVEIRGSAVGAIVGSIANAIGIRIILPTSAAAQGVGHHQSAAHCWLTEGGASGCCGDTKASLSVADPSAVKPCRNGAKFIGNGDLAKWGAKGLKMLT